MLRVTQLSFITRCVRIVRGLGFCIAAIPACCLLNSCSLFAADAIPFVVGFDRFGRHADIDKTTSGRLLITELSCTACHSTTDKQLQPKEGPILNGVGSRLQSTWVESFLIEQDRYIASLKSLKFIEGYIFFYDGFCSCEGFFRYNRKFDIFLLL